MQSSWGVGSLWLLAFRHCWEVAWVERETYSTGLSQAGSSIPHVMFSSGFQAPVVVVFCQTALYGRWVGFYEEWKSADKTKEEAPVSSSCLLKPTDGVGKEGGLTRSSGKAESRKSTSKQRLGRGQKQCQVQREMERGKPELPAPSLTKRAVSGNRGKSGGWLKQTHCREEEVREIWGKENSLQLKEKKKKK